MPQDVFAMTPEAQRMPPENLAQVKFQMNQLEYVFGNEEGIMILPGSITQNTNQNNRFSNLPRPPPQGELYQSNQGIQRADFHAGQTYYNNFQKRQTLLSSFYEDNGLEIQEMHMYR